MTTADFARELAVWEGRFSWLYLDVKGLVTVGVGNLVPSAAACSALPFTDPVLGRAATDDEKRAAFETIARMPHALRAPAYADATRIRLPEAAIDELLTQRIEGEFLPGVKRLLPAFDFYPDPARLALVDIAFNCGVRGLASFHNLLAACRARDWSGAALSCHRAPPTRETRNGWAKEQFMAAGDGRP